MELEHGWVSTSHFYGDVIISRLCDVITHAGSNFSAKNLIIPTE